MEQSPSQVRGRLIHHARAYDALVWILLRGKTRQHLNRILDTAHVESGQSVLDVGCGTGSLAIAASERVGSRGKVHGIDASRAMIDRARMKAAKAGSSAIFTEATVESIPFPDAEFDTVLCTMMLHHLPRAARERCAHEMRRVLAPGGTALVIEFGAEGTSLIERLHRHGALKRGYVGELLESAGFTIAESGPAGINGLYFIRAMATAPLPVTPRP